jgi:hypothetical protein
MQGLNERDCTQTAKPIKSLAPLVETVTFESE